MSVVLIDTRAKRRTGGEPCQEPTFASWKKKSGVPCLPQQKQPHCAMSFLAATSGIAVRSAVYRDFGSLRCGLPTPSLADSVLRNHQTRATLPCQDDAPAALHPEPNRILEPPWTQDSIPTTYSIQMPTLLFQYSVSVLTCNPGRVAVSTLFPKRGYASENEPTRIPATQRRLRSWAGLLLRICDVSIS
jgi:hypothetical protein